MTQYAGPRPTAILMEVREAKAVHHATAHKCINSLQALSGATRDRIAVSQALLGRVADRLHAPQGLPTQPEAAERSRPDALRA